MTHAAHPESTALRDAALCGESGHRRDAECYAAMKAVTRMGMRAAVIHVELTRFEGTLPMVTALGSVFRIDRLTRRLDAKPVSLNAQCVQKSRKNNIDESVYAYFDMISTVYIYSRPLPSESAYAGIRAAIQSFGSRKSMTPVHQESSGPEGQSLWPASGKVHIRFVPGSAL